MNRFLLNALLVGSLLGASAFAQSNLQTASNADLAKIGKQRTTELQSAVVLTEDLTSANAKRIRLAFESAFEFIDTVVQRSDISPADKLDLIEAISESVAAAYGDTAAPFTDVDLADNSSGSIGDKILAQAKALVGFAVKQFSFVFVNPVRSVLGHKDAETPLESMRRVRIGKDVFDSLSQSADIVLKGTDANQPLNDFQKKAIGNYVSIVNAGIKSEPYRYRHFTRGVMTTLLSIAGFYALAPIGLQEHILFMPPVDFFPPFTEMHRTFTSVFISRGLWTMYGAIFSSIPRISTGYGLGSKIAKVRDKFQAIRARAGISTTDCELGVVGTAVTRTRIRRKSE